MTQYAIRRVPDSSEVQVVVYEEGEDVGEVVYTAIDDIEALRWIEEANPGFTAFLSDDEDDTSVTVDGETIH